MTSVEKTTRKAEALREIIIRRSRESFAYFVCSTKPDYDIQWFHKIVAEKLQQFADGKIKKMMILMPPQHGKTELATRRLSAYLMGRNPKLKLAIASYGDTMVQSFSRDIQRIIDSPLYNLIFPGVYLAGSAFTDQPTSDYARNNHEFEIVGTGGIVKTVARGGGLTGSAVDIGIIDDLYKDRAEAKSVLVSQSAWEWYTDVFKTRLHNNSQQLIMNTRWDQMDLAGRIILQEGEQWEIIKFTGIKNQDQVEYDHRKEGEALWPQRHSLERLLDIKSHNQITFNSLYQQDPKPDDKLIIFHDWIEIPEWPTTPNLKGEMVPMEIDSWGLDFGKTTGINALVKHAINGNDVYFEEHLYEPGVGCEYIAEILLKNGYVRGVPVYCDHMPTKIAELRRLGIAAFPAVKGEGSIDAGIQKLKGFKVHYTRRSVNIKRESSVYQYLTYGDLITNKPVDEDNHSMDACRYSNYSQSFKKK